MIRFAQVCTGIALALLAAAAPVSAGQPSAERTFTWLASSSTEPTIGAGWGRLTIRDGVLAFRSTETEWQISVAEIRRAAPSPQSDRLLEIEDADGSVRYVAIIGSTMLVESPRKTLDVIQRAMRVHTASRRY
jgi:hypothetical protein